MIKDFADEFDRYRAVGQKAIDQVTDEELNRALGDDGNSIAVIMRHIGGNLVSRFTDFLTTDGEKPWRKRDTEFESVAYERVQIQAIWDRGWVTLGQQLAALGDTDLSREVLIRGHALTVHEALSRSLAHIAYHVGQIVLLARIFKGGEWLWISIPRSASEEYNRNPTREKTPG